MSRLRNRIFARFQVSLVAFAFALPLVMVGPQEVLAAPSYKHPIFCEREFKGQSHSEHNHGWALDIISTTPAYTHGQEVIASAGGTVVIRDLTDGEVVINHGGGFRTVYAHMSSIAVNEGQAVSTGQLLGFIDNVGPLSQGDHLHYAQLENYTTPVKVRFNGSSTAYNYNYNATGYGSKITSNHCPSTPAVDIFTITGERRTAIEWLYSAGHTGGCGDKFDGTKRARYCPDGLVNRLQMAQFLDRILDLPNATTDYFDDDDYLGAPEEQSINNVAKAGITAGCGERAYCPDGIVLRDQMATFLVRAFDVPSTSTDYFDDDDGNKHEARINAAARAGITVGCPGERTYCPSDPVNRGAMAQFLYRATH